MPLPPYEWAVKIIYSNKYIAFVDTLYFIGGQVSGGAC
jgi:hypothetical protein